jgi:hypothetical protein
MAKALTLDEFRDAANKFSARLFCYGLAFGKAISLSMMSPKPSFMIAAFAALNVILAGELLYLGQRRIQTKAETQNLAKGVAIVGALPLIITGSAIGTYASEAVSMHYPWSETMEFLGFAYGLTEGSAQGIRKFFRFLPSDFSL